MGEAAVSVWKRLAAVAGRAASGGDIWDDLRTALNPALYRPCRSPDAVSFALTTRHGQPYHIVSNRTHRTYLRLGPEEFALWSMMDGASTLKDLIVAHFTRTGTLAFGLVSQLVAHLRQSSMLADPPVDAFGDLRRRLAQLHAKRIPLLVWQVMIGQRTLATRRVDGAIEWLYRRGAWLLYTFPARVFFLAVSAAGLWLFSAQLISGRFRLFTVDGSYTKGLILLYVLNYVTIGIHELAHALTCKHYGARVNGAGAMLYFGLPAFYIDTSDIWTKPARARIATSWAGPYSGLILAGICSLLVALRPEWPLSPVLHRLSFLSVVIVLFNLIPLLELDGYFILIDWLEVPMLRRRALTFVRRDLWVKLRRREPFTPQERLLAWFGALSIGFSGFVIYLAVQFWRRRLGPVIAELWAGGLGSRMLLVLLLLALTLPVIVGLGGRAVMAGRAATGWVRARWQRPRRRTMAERIALLRRVQFLAPLPEERFAEIAGRMRRETFRADDTVIARGGEGDRFYVIESGEAEVLLDGENHRAVLTAGDYFGEVALLYRVPRSATVRAVTPLAVLGLRKGDFDRLLAGHVGAALQLDEAISALERLRGFPAFARLADHELDVLAAHLTRERYEPGTVVVAEGDPADAFYLIDSGQAEVITAGRRVHILNRGDYFGEIALLLDVPRTATVRTLTPVDVLKLKRIDFEQLLSTVLAPLAGALDAVSRQRLAASGHVPSGG